VELSELPEPSPCLRAVVVVPARDEEASIGACIAALAAQRGIDPADWEILLVLDGCTDATSERARAALPAMGPVMHEVALGGLGAGGARAAGMDQACLRLEPLGRPDGLIATTDADSVVAPDWLRRQLEASAAGAEAIGGMISLHPEESERLDPETLRRRRGHHEARIASLEDGGPTEHAFFGGASIGITARAYREVGGMEPLEALEDEALARRLRARGVPIHRLGSVRVSTSARTVGRAPRGLARDLLVSEWSRRRTWDAADFGLEGLLAAEPRTASLIRPAKEVAGTIGSIVESLVPLRDAGLLEEILVVDADSDDGTATVAAASGARVVSESELLPEFGTCRGKGDAMWRAATAANGDVLVFCDADSADFEPSFALGLLGPILTEPGVRLVKGAFQRPMQVGADVLPGEGGRVTELVARPLLNLHRSELAGIEQPLAGEIAIDRALFEQLSVPVGYGVEIAMLLDCLDLAGLEAIAQSRLGSRQNRHQPLRALGRMAYEVIVAAQRRLDGPAPSPGPLLLPGPDPDRLEPRCEERPPLASLRDAPARARSVPA
jgi:glycosyltransferase involved in cell wall biosynthesis